jgi:hypothetical protein
MDFLNGATIQTQFPLWFCKINHRSRHIESAGIIDRVCAAKDKKNTRKLRAIPALLTADTSGFHLFIRVIGR